MPIVKMSPDELAIHGGGPPAFEVKLPAFSANVGDGPRFAELAERMFLDAAPGRLVDEFEQACCDWLGVRNAVGFSCQSTALRSTLACLRQGRTVLAPAFGSSTLPPDEPTSLIEIEPATRGMSPSALAASLRQEPGAVFAVNACGHPSMIAELEEVCGELPLVFLSHQAFGTTYRGERLGGSGRAEIFTLGRDELIHALDAAIVTTNDDLLAYRLRQLRSTRPEGIDQRMSDASAAMGIANLESAEAFLTDNRARHDAYAAGLGEVPGISLLRCDGHSRQTVTVQVDAGQSGLSRNALHDVLVAENVGVAKPFDAEFPASHAPVAAKVGASLLQLPSGPAATLEAIEAVCRLIELAVVRSLESPDPIRVAA